MRLPAVLLATVILAAQEQAPVGLVRGDLLEMDAAGATGELSIRSPDNRVFRFLYDGRTYIERDKQRIPASKLKSGETLEIVSDTGAGASLRYARIVHVIERELPQKRPASLGRLRSYRNVTEHIMPRGNMTFSGVISRLNQERMLLRTRIDGEKTIFLRLDTRFIEGGSVVESSSLKPNTRVFVRAGRNLENEIEAYQVVWGEILSPSDVR